MAKIVNKTRRDVALLSMHIIPAKGTLEVANDVVRGDNWALLQALHLSGDLEVTLDPEVVEEGMALPGVPDPLPVRGPIVEGGSTPLPVEQTKSPKTPK